jgi:prepilin-type N-terminal cleavage/methylation domain-containing protein
MTPGGDHERGFTLIELLAAMLAGALLLAWLGWAVGGIGERAARNAAPPPRAALLAAWPSIAAQIESAYYAPETARSDDLLVMPPLSLGQRGPAALRYRAERSEGGSMALVSTYRDPATGTALAPPSTLVSGFADIAVDSVSGTEGQRPALRFAFTEADGTRFALTARPQVTAEPGCRFDPISLACRP